MAEVTLPDFTMPEKMCILAGFPDLDSVDKFLGDIIRRVNALAGTILGNCED